jgi:hypothetical protein
MSHGFGVQRRAVRTRVWRLVKMTLERSAMIGLENVAVKSGREKMPVNLIFSFFTANE